MRGLGQSLEPPGTRAGTPHPPPSASLPQALAGRKGPGPVCLPRFRKKRAPSQAGGSCSLQREGSTASCQPASRTVAFPSLPPLVIDHKALPPMKGFRAKAGPGTLSAGVREQSPAGPTMSLTRPRPTSSRPPVRGARHWPPPAVAASARRFPAPRGSPKGRPAARLRAGRPRGAGQARTPRGRPAVPPPRAV